MVARGDTVGKSTEGPVRFDGAVAVVTGAGRGMGREFALLLAARGAAVVVNDNRPDDGTADCAAGVVREIEAAGGRAVANTADVSDPMAAETIVQDAIDAFGAITIVINNAGNRRFKSLYCTPSSGASSRATMRPPNIDPSGSMMLHTHSAYERRPAV